MDANPEVVSVENCCQIVRSILIVCLCLFILLTVLTGKAVGRTQRLNSQKFVLDEQRLGDADDTDM